MGGLALQRQTVGGIQFAVAIVIAVARVPDSVAVRVRLGRVWLVWAIVSRVVNLVLIEVGCAVRGATLSVFADVVAADAITAGCAAIQGA